MDVGQLTGNPVSTRITERVIESSRAISLFFELKDRRFAPGQFVMVWVPGTDEIPMSIGMNIPPKTGITVQSIGEATKVLSELSEGSWLGIRGPFGNTFTTSDCDKALLVGGGVGVVPLYFLCKELLQKGTKVTAIWAARTAEDVILYDLEKLDDKNFQLVITTDDGSKGLQGFATDAVKQLLEKQRFEKIYTCGPEVMMHQTFLLAQQHDIPLEASLERFMKCGCGLCGTCSLDLTGDLVCIDGPVFDSVQLAKMDDFGKFHRDAMGLKKKC